MHGLLWPRIRSHTRSLPLNCISQRSHKPAQLQREGHRTRCWMGRATKNLWQFVSHAGSGFDLLHTFGPLVLFFSPPLCSRPSSLTYMTWISLSLFPCTHSHALLSHNLFSILQLDNHKNPNLLLTSLQLLRG